METPIEEKWVDCTGVNLVTALYYLFAVAAHKIDVETGEIDLLNIDVELNHIKTAFDKCSTKLFAVEEIANIRMPVLFERDVVFADRSLNDIQRVDVSKYDRIHGIGLGAKAIQIAKNAVREVRVRNASKRTVGLIVSMISCLSMILASQADTRVVDGIEYVYSNGKITRARIVDGKYHGLIDVPDLSKQGVDTIAPYSPKDSYGLGELDACDLVLPECIHSCYDTSFANGTHGQNGWGTWICGASRFKSIFFKGDRPTILDSKKSGYSDSDLHSNWLRDSKVYCIEGNESWRGITSYYGAKVEIGAASVEILPAKQYVDFQHDKIELKCTNVNAICFYTLDGSVPQTNETQSCFCYTAPFFINKTTTVKACAYVPEYKYTVVSEKTYEARVPNPVISAEVVGEYYFPMKVTISCAQEDAEIHCKVGDGGMAYHFEYTEPFVISNTVCVSASAYKEGWTCSDTVSELFTRRWYTVATPQLMAPEVGTFHLPMDVMLSCDTPDTIVRYTVDGQNVDETSPVYAEPLNISKTTTFHVKAFKKNWSNSVEVVQTFTRLWYTNDTPVIEAAASFSAASQVVTLSCATDGATIYYTVDGSEPSAANGRVYKGPFDIYQTTTVKAIAVKDDWKDSAVASATFTKENAIGPAINLLEVLPDNDKTHPWEVVTDVTHDGVGAVKSGSIEDEESTTLKAVIYGAGRLSFWWRTSCEPAIDGEYYDFATFFNGTTEVARLAGATDWQQVTLDVAGTGKHTFKWTYQKDDSGTTVPDGVWLDQVQWLPQTDDYYSTHTLTTETPVPYAWLDKYGLGRQTDFEAAAKAKSGKVDGAGRELTIEEEYIAGTDPTNATSQLKAFVDLSEGYPKVTWEPDLNEDGTKTLRTYKVWGKEALDDGAAWVWPTNALHRFFKVTVEMP